MVTESQSDRPHPDSQPDRIQCETHRIGYRHRSPAFPCKSHDLSRFLREFRPSSIHSTQRSLLPAQLHIYPAKPSYTAFPRNRLRPLRHTITLRIWVQHELQRARSEDRSEPACMPRRKLVQADRIAVSTHGGTLERRQVDVVGNKPNGAVGHQRVNAARMSRRQIV